MPAGKNSDAVVRELMAQYQAETDPGKKQVLYNKIYVPDNTITRDQQQSFNYVVDGYINDNPGPPQRTLGSKFEQKISYVGIFY